MNLTRNNIIFRKWFFSLDISFCDKNYLLINRDSSLFSCIMQLIIFTSSYKALSSHLILY